MSVTPVFSVLDTELTRTPAIGLLYSSTILIFTFPPWAAALWVAANSRKKKINKRRKKVEKEKKRRKKKREKKREKRWERRKKREKKRE